LAALRILFGAVFLANGLSKAVNRFLFDWGPVKFTLISRESARNILDGSANGGGTHPLPGIQWLVNHLLLPNYGTLQWALTAAELAIGISLLLGLASRASALLAAVMLLCLNVLVIGNFAYVFEYPVEWLPLLVLAIVPAGHTWGLDRRVSARMADRWPF
jgi:uncharacterized membrane protein YphA (DoxX/SURF4 family)